MQFSTVLRGGDRRSIGRANAVVREVERRPGRFGELWRCLSDGDPLVRMRAADAIEKISRKRPALLAPYKKALLAFAPDDGTAAVRWHLAALIGRLTLSTREARAAIRRLELCLADDDSRVVKVMALQAVADICDGRAALSGERKRVLAGACASPWPSVRARARKIGGG